VKKFERLAAESLPKDQIERLRDSVLNVESLSDAAQIVDLMRVAQ
jgi:hypothetical protein